MATYKNILDQITPGPVTSAANSRQVENNTGGFVYKTSDRDAFMRFLILGTTTSTYYESSADLTKQAVGLLERVRDNDGAWMLEQILQVSTAGRAPKQDAAIFALAFMTLSKDPAIRSAVYDAIPTVCRTGSTLLQFVSEADGLGRGWGSGFSRGVKNWFYSGSADELAYQVSKYASRHGWTMADVLRKVKPQGTGQARNPVFAWVAGRPIEGELPSTLQAIEQMKVATTVQEVVDLITANKLVHEAVPKEWLKHREVWEALVPSMPIGALIRNLGTLSARGLLTQGSEYSKLVQTTITDAERIKKARLHPYNLAIAMKTYSRGAGVKGSQTWDVNQRIVASLEEAINLSFGLVEPTGKRYEIALDVSLSMTWGRDLITPCEATILMSMPLYRTEECCGLYGFSNTYRDLTKGIGVKSSYRDALRAVENLPHGSTNVGLTIKNALRSKRPVDVFIVMTDNEVNQGSHVSELLNQYRQVMGIPAKLVVCGFTATQFTVGDPNDPGTLNIAGMDSALPSIVREFSLL